MRVERGVVRVEDAHGQPPTIPFWLGEAPGRSDELSASVSRLRTGIRVRLHRDHTGGTARHWLVHDIGLGEAAAAQLLEYLSASLAALGCLPTQDTVVLERFFDEAGGMQLVIHSTFGSRINRAWGLALRKRFCRRFNFELQAAATEDNIVLSLTTTHSFELAEVARYLHAASVRPLLVQAVLDAPMFATRWRWVAGVALALPRFRGGRKVAPQLARMEAEDLVAAVFPDQLACAENVAGDREVPDHPLTNQTIADCLHEAMDVEGLERLLARIEAGDVSVVCCDLTQPSPLALEVLSARPYAYLDDAPLEERRTQAVMARRWRTPDSADEIGQLDPHAIARVRGEAWPDPLSAEELHDALLWLGCLSTDEADAGLSWQAWLIELAGERRAARLTIPGATLWVATERLRQWLALWPEARPEPDVAPLPDQRDWSRGEALVELLRSRLEGLGPVTVEGLAEPLGLDAAAVAATLTALEAEGFALRGRFTPGGNAEEWCDRRLLARIHHYTIRRLRAEIEPVAARDFLRFLFDWQHVTGETRLEGPDAVPVAAALLEGFEAPAGAWETELLPARIAGYEPSWLDDMAGRITWRRLTLAARSGRERQAALVRTASIALLARQHAGFWHALAGTADTPQLGSGAQAVLDCLSTHGALFFAELPQASGLLAPQVEDALCELVAWGLVTSDNFGGLRALLVPSDRRKPSGGGSRRRRILSFGMEDAGRWALVRHPSEAAGAAALEHVAHALLRRYGVVFWRLLAREPDWLPPWRDLVRVYRRLEARGEIRGGRFVAGFAGEQYALPDALGMLRQVRRRPHADEFVSLSGADPLNSGRHPDAGRETRGGHREPAAFQRWRSDSNADRP